ncbi:hypothetical protein FQN54_001418 [Arachnomyces sp. PD_36]|nr:hypothetical protein FQN54_001418 [Arachnomyces sp. PD_36]
MERSWIPRIFQPDFTWPRPMRPTVAETTPSLPRLPSSAARRLWGALHRVLYHVSERYCRWFNINFNAHILELPFGLVMKWTDRTSLEEAMAMQLARKAGMPVPKVLCCGEHPTSFNRPFSILMTRLPGISLENSRDPFEADAEDPWVNELKNCLQSMRLWQGPKNRICSVVESPIRSPRVPRHVMGPFESEADLHAYLLSPASSHGFKSSEEYEETLSRAKKIRQDHRITFTHGDFKAHNILIDDDGHLSGFLDWESAGWCPEYWEFATAMRFGKNSWWYQVASWMGGDQYLEELDADVALNLLTVDSYIAM